MTSTIKVDTISENTSANGVAVDGATLKDGTVKASINTSTQTTAAITLDNTVSGGFGASLAWDVHRSDSGNQATAARIYPSRADVWNSDAASDSDLNFQVSQNGTVATRMTVSGTGDVSIADGNLLFQGAGHGVYLGVTSATAANLLDDYEEGTWTPTFTSGGNTLSFSGGSETYKYTKIGNVCTITVNIANCTTSGTAATGDNRITLPFTSASGARQPTSIISYFSSGGLRYTGADVLYAECGSSTAFIQFVEWVNSTGYRNISSAPSTGSGTYFWFSFTYLTA